ncbi:MAG TPA: SAM-dependent methyltransferase [Pseudonocardiaceae bacterium]|nr:SAM-dependent methyltransferase [Pseudonocardiaceae bacterium]
MAETAPPPEPASPPGVDLDHPSVARVYDFYLGGTANWAIDREFGKRVLSAFPLLRPIAIANRMFLHRAVRHLVRLGVRQFVDIGSGVPTMGNTHAVAGEVAPDSRVVYVDNEPVAVAHSKVLLEEHGDPVRHAAINADLRYPDQLWQAVADTGVLDLSQPVALLFIAVLHVKQPGPDGEDTGAEVLARYRELLAPGSFLAISQITDDGVPEDLGRNLVELKRMYETRSTSEAMWRSQAQIRDLFGDFELVEPGLTWTPLWHPEESSPDAPSLTFASPNESVIWAGAGRKP